MKTVFDFPHLPASYFLNIQCKSFPYGIACPASAHEKAELQIGCQCRWETSYPSMSTTRN